MSKNMTAKNQKFMTNISEKIQGRPRKVPRRSQDYLQSSGEKYFSIKFHHFRAKYFSSFQNFPPHVPDTVTTKFEKPVQIWLIFHNL